MKKAIKLKDSQREDSLMKSVLEELNIKVSPTTENSKFNLRELFWNYPESLIKVYKKLVPVSYLILFVFFSFIFILFLQSKSIENFLSSDVKKDTYVEGIIGGVNSLNPLFVTNNYIERSIDNLIFEKFVNIDSEGNPFPGIAKSWVIKDQGLRYEFKIDKGHFWVDGTEVSIEDVIFSFESAIKLSNESGFDSVGLAFADMEVIKINEDTLQFKVKEANPVFFRAVSIFIVPQKQFENTDIKKMAFDPFSKEPVGSGKYGFVKMDSNSVYLIDNPYDKYLPQIKNLIFKMYPDQKSLEMAFRVGKLDGMGSWDRETSKFVDEYESFVKYQKIIPDREKLIFFNTRKDSLNDRNIRIALNLLFKKSDIMEEYNSGGEILSGPLPSTSWAYNKDIDFHEYDFEKAKRILKDLGYEINPTSGFFENSQGEILTFTLSYLNNSSNERFVKLIEKYFKEEGVFLKLEKLDYEKITQEVIATRNFELLLYEIETSVDPDQYNLWHSLKSNYPDLNLSGYNYERVDILLEEGRQSLDRNVRKQKYTQFQKYLIADSPAIFLYNPLFEFIVHKNLKGIDFNPISNSYDRFHNIESWSWE